MAKKFAKSKLNKFRKIFEQKRQEILAKLSKPDDSELDIDGDDVDIVQGKLISELHNHLSQRDFQQLKRIEIAINKISDGTFGNCELCDEQIGEKRLLALPGCTICIKCAEEEETTARQFAS